MKIISNNIFPFKGFTAVTIYPFVFVRKGKVLSDRMVRHEAIHSMQQKEMLLLLFYVWYVVEWVFRLVMYRNLDKAYRNISFEMEAYANQDEVEYMERRSPYSWVRYIKGDRSR